MTGSSFPEFITSRRRELDLTLGDVASRLGVSPITVSNWSNGETRPKPENLVALAGLLDVPAQELAEMAGITLAAPDASVNLMPKAAETPPPAEPPADEVAVEEPVAAVRMPDPAPDLDEIAENDGPSATEDVTQPDAPNIEIPDRDEVPIPAIKTEQVATPAETEPDAKPEPEIGEQRDPVPAETPDSVPAFVAAAPATEPTSPARRRPSLRRPTRRTAAAEPSVAVLPLTYIEDPKQLMRYRIRWALTVVVLAVMFFILLWASRELLSALSEVKQAVTPGGIGGG